MDKETFLEHCKKIPSRSQYGDDDDQKEVISYGAGPLWVVAGPGSGKTDSMVLRCLKLMIVDGVNPKSIVVTTFTEKAARNLEDRIGLYMQYFVQVDPELRKMDYTQLRTGTLHSLANDIMQEYRYSGYQNYRLLEDLEESLYILEHSSFCAPGRKFDSDLYKPIWQDARFQGYFRKFSKISKKKWSPGSQYPPNRWVRTEFARKAFDTIVNEDLNADTLVSSNVKAVSLIGELYKGYVDKLESTFRVDFSQLQQKFLRFLESQESRPFLEGDGTDIFPGVKYVLVDEYQDTNTIQEKIYFKLASTTGNLCVVGDDDQALYRFRGGRVELMIRFPEQCQREWPSLTTKIVYLHTNYRSHSKIVKACDGFIKSFVIAGSQDARVNGKPDLLPGSTISGDYPAAAIVVERGMGGRNSGLQELAIYFASTVKDMKENGIIEDYSDVALLMPSTKNTTAASRAFMEALDHYKIPYYNPRGVPVIESEEVQTLMGAILHLIDRDGDHFFGNMEGVRTLIDKWRNTYINHATTHPEIARYVNSVADNIRRKDKGVNIGANLLELVFFILGFEPFISWLEDPVRSLHLGLVTQVFDSFSNVPSSRNSQRMLGSIYTSGWREGVSKNWIDSFYFSLVSMLAELGLTEEEDEDISYPSGMVPIMTIHQSKGLEFPFVFVHGLSSWDSSKDDIIFEMLLREESGVSIQKLSDDDIEKMAKLDVARMFYVAYSRAQYAVIALAQKEDQENAGIGCGGRNWSVFRNFERIRG